VNTASCSTRDRPGSRYIATTCPAVVGYVERYWPELVGHLAPVVSPMVAMARVLHKMHGPDVRTVFIGPCLAKKVEASMSELEGEVDAVITFAELRTMFLSHGVDAASTEGGFRSAPRRHRNTVPAQPRFVSGRRHQRGSGSTEAVAAHGGPGSFVNAIEEFAGGDLDFGWSRCCAATAACRGRA
jgi:iron only hydrogenase large subunit-like protein